MFLAGKAACAGIILLLLATWISGPRPTKVVPGPNLSKEEPAVGFGTISLRCRRLSVIRDITEGRSMGVRPSNTGGQQPGRPRKGISSGERNTRSVVACEHFCSDLSKPDLLSSKSSGCAQLSLRICVRV